MAKKSSKIRMTSRLDKSGVTRSEGLGGGPPVDPSAPVSARNPNSINTSGINDQAPPVMDY